jgi:two-component system NtrC family sensor kinase
VFFQVLRNALQAVGDRGRISIATQCIDRHVHVRITDTGPGIREEHLSKLFEPSFTTRDVGGGTGLGLNLAYNIMKKHHGRISVDTKSGCGCTFTISIPMD